MKKYLFKTISKFKYFMTTNIKYLTAIEALNVDKELMNDDYAFDSPQLMELAGQSVSHLVYKIYPKEKFQKVLVV
jgi:NAD(P)H-hydrate epimerase